MTIIRMTLVIAPIALPTALVRRPTEPSSSRAEVARLASRHQAELGERIP